MTAHTPGPWEMRLTGFNECDVAIPAKMRRSTRLLTLGGLQDTTAEDIANAHLIAAAPDLLAACEAIMQKASTVLAVNGSTSVYEIDPHKTLGQIEQIARAAIEKARGSSAPRAREAENNVPHGGGE